MSWIKHSTSCISLETVQSFIYFVLIFSKEPSCTIQLQNHFHLSQFSSEDEDNFTLEDSFHLTNRASDFNSSLRKACLLTYVKWTADKVMYDLVAEEWMRTTPHPNPGHNVCTT